MTNIVSQLTIARVLDAIISRGLAAQRDMIAALDGIHKTTISSAVRTLHQEGCVELVTDPDQIRSAIAIKSGPIRAWRATEAGKAAALGQYNPATATCRPSGKSRRPTRSSDPPTAARATVEEIESDIYDALIDSRPLTADELCAAVKAVRSEDQSMPRATMVETARVRMGRRGELLAISPTHADYPADSTQPHRIAYTLARTKPATQPQEATP